MKYTRRGKPQRTFAALIMLIMGLGAVVVGLTASTASAATDHCAAHTTSPKTSGTGDQYLDVGGTQVWVDINGTSVSFYAADKVTPLNVDFCIKASTGESGAESGTGGSVDWLNPGGQTPTISYVVVYAVNSFEPGSQSQTRGAKGEPNCETDTVPTWQERRTRTEVSEGVWNEWGAWEKVEGSDSTREATDEECPPDVLGSESQIRDGEGEPDCETDTVPEWQEKRTRPMTNGVPGAWSDWAKVAGSDSTRSATDEECPSSTPSTPIETLPNESSAPNPGGGEPEVLGIEANAPAAAPAAAPTAVDAGLTAQESGSSTLWILAGGALALAGLVLGFSPATPRGKRTI